MKQKAFQPADVLNMYRHVQSKLSFYVGPSGVREIVHLSCHDVNDVAWYKAYRKEDY